jgi:hypothetical protein
MGPLRVSTARLTAGVLTFLLLTAGVVAAATVDEASPATETVAGGSLGASQFSTEPLDEAPTTTTAPPPAPVTSTPSTSAGPTAAPPLPGARTPGAVTTPFKAGRTEWTGVSNGITFRLVMTTASPRAGEPVTFLAEASMPAGAMCCHLMLQFGDGSEGVYPPYVPLGDHSPCSSREPTSNTVRGEISHVYNKAGRWNFSLSARWGPNCTVGPTGYGSLDGQLEIGGGAAPTPQGPALPAVRPASIYPYAPRVITLAADVADNDGYIDRVLVDWGDGSPSESYKNPQPCKPTPGGWPGGTHTKLPHWMGVESVTHRYADDTPRKVTVTAISTGCNGTGEQSGSASITFPEPPAPPPPLSSVPWPTMTNVPPPPPISSIPVPPPTSLPTPTLTP